MIADSKEGFPKVDRSDYNLDHGRVESDFVLERYNLG